MMQLGSTLEPFQRYGEQRYEMMKKYGFTCCDFDVSNTSTAFYTASEDELKKLLHRA